MEKILVIGSSNTDLITTMDHFPAAGETLTGGVFQQAMGGKGANQALAAHRSGGDVTFMTSLGKDAYGLNALQYYRDQGLEVSLSLLTDHVSSGIAMIWVDKKGENCIVVIPGANLLLSPEYVLAHQQAIDTADIIVLQMEIPYETIKTVCRIASRKGKKIILNVAPAAPLEEEILQSVHMLVVNQTEAELLTGERIDRIGEEAIVDLLLATGVRNVVLTLGKKGSLYKNNQELLRIPAFQVEAVDTTAAGDTFCGALAARLSRGEDMKTSLEFAAAAAALCVTRMGAQPSIPTEAEVVEFLSVSK
ncbi:MAG TPA: ribokinase [Prolixibacteraceae bacterium]|nr:ribokinase [Prolixibacteraceae bacterium]